ncbi:MAG TPA: ABC transporter ATP-binding protein [Acidisphaera sp.]|nr:ABC transporter ATP-binding protein [Acidisphaera sp.]
MIAIEHLTRRFGDATAVDDISLVIPRRALCALIGPSGSGKSTTLRMINRLIEPSAGRVMFDGRDAATIPDLRLRIGYAIQSVGLFPHWTVARNIATVPALLGWPRARRDARVAELLALLELDPALARRYPHQLSGGQAQRVGVARALAAEPEALLMDEPFGALDPITRVGLQDELRRIHRRIGTTIVLVTHDMEEALRLADLIAVMRDGRILQAGAPADLLRAPVDDFVRDFVGGGEAGLRLLGLHAAGTLANPHVDADGDPVPAAATLREVLSALVARRADAVHVADADGRIIGAIRLHDIMNLAAQTDAS